VVVGLPAFTGDPAIVYYLPGTSGWGVTFAGRPTALWNPQLQSNDASFGVGPNGFGFNVLGTSNIFVVVEACTSASSAIWYPLATNSLTGGSCFFSDPEWRKYPARFYRLRWP
jgi:hypothetical protein